MPRTLADVFPEPADTMDEAPVRIKQLVEMANYEIDFSRPARMYFRSGVEMVRMANVYADEGNLEGAYVLYLKFMTIFLEKIRQHPEYKLVSPGERAAIKRHLEATLPRAEAIKRKLGQRYEQEHQQWLAEQQRREEELQLRRQEEERRLSQLQLDERERRRFSEEKSRLLELERRRAEQLERSLDQPPSHDPGSRLPSAAADRERAAQVESTLPSYADLLPSPPTAPPSYHASQRPADASKPSVPSIDRSVKPKFQSLMSLRSDLRTVVVPDSLMTRFLKIAEPNTAANVETCGLLCGKPTQDKLNITHLLIPVQSGTADSCSMEGEEKVFLYLDTHNLITMGWIHTHPSQTAFLSSVDLHTHCGYQLMMLESVAIVCAPKYNDTGFFTLTPQYGLDYIARCKREGFHPHPQNPPLFEEAQHVTLDETYEINVVDLRNK